MHRLALIATIFVVHLIPAAPRRGISPPITPFALLLFTPRTRPGFGRARSQLMHSTICVAFMATLSRH